MIRKYDTSHHLTALGLALRVMAERGFSAADCLRGTGLTEQDLLRPSTEVGLQLEQEFCFHRNLLALTGDPLLGLATGRTLLPDSHGLLGYAFLSARTLRQSMVILRTYGPLTFSPFRLDFAVEGRTGVFSLEPELAIPEDLQQYYTDRELTAIMLASSRALDAPLEIESLEVSHDCAKQADYVQHFHFPVRFGAAVSRLRMHARVLDGRLPRWDPETNSVCVQQCQILLARLGSKGPVAGRLRRLLAGREGTLADIETAARALELTGRTLRRRLQDEGTSYQQVLDQVRYGLAREYLADRSLQLAEIASRLGYSNPGNFSIAFKRWHGSSPRHFRRQSAPG